MNNENIYLYLANADQVLFCSLLYLTLWFCIPGSDNRMVQMQEQTSPNCFPHSAVQALIMRSYWFWVCGFTVRRSLFKLLYISSTCKFMHLSSVYIFILSEPDLYWFGRSFLSELSFQTANFNSKFVEQCGTGFTNWLIPWLNNIPQNAFTVCFVMGRT